MKHILYDIYIIYTHSFWISCLYLFNIFTPLSICEIESYFVLVWFWHQDCNDFIKHTDNFSLIFYSLEWLFREGDGTPLQYSCLENPMDRGAWWAAVHAVAKSWTRLSDFPFTFHFHALEKEMATHSSVLAWRIPGTAEPGGLPSLGSHRVGHDWSNLAAVAAMYKLLCTVSDV